MSRRARITPEQVGLNPGARRRVSGLRREEVAQLAGISTEYYTQVERGRVTGVFDEVLYAVSRALRLSDDEMVRFFDLVRAAVGTRATPRSRRAAIQKLPEGVQALMDGMVASPAIVMNGTLDILAANSMGRVLYSLVVDKAGGRANLAKFIFFDPAAAQIFPDWTATADEAVGLLQAEAARAPQSPAITQLVGELATRSTEFRTRWAAHNVTAHRQGTKHFSHPEFGELVLTYNVFEITAEPGLFLVGYTAEPGTRSAQAMSIMASWSAGERLPFDPAVTPAEADDH